MGDSIPAILSITTDPFLVVTSNCFAVMGLRSLFFVLSALQGMFKYLPKGLSLILGGVGVKMVIGYFGWHISASMTLLSIVAVLLVSIFLSVVWKDESVPGVENNQEGRNTDQ